MANPTRLNNPYRLMIPGPDGPIVAAISVVITGSTGDRRIVHYNERPGSVLDAFPYQIGVDEAVMRWAALAGVREIHYERRGSKGLYILQVKDPHRPPVYPSPVRDFRRVFFYPIAHWDRYMGKRWYDLPENGDSVRLGTPHQHEETAQGVMF